MFTYILESFLGELVSKMNRQMNRETALSLLFYFWKIKLKFWFSFQKYMSLNLFSNKKNLDEFTFSKNFFSSAKVVLYFAVF